MRRADIEVPNLAVDVDSRARSACYPRGSFYPLSPGPSTRAQRITSPDFRPCSGCPPRSQAPLRRCTPRPVSIRPEGTVGRLRYRLGGDRPSQTARQPRSSRRVHGVELGASLRQGGISPSAPRPPEGADRRLPPILRSRKPTPTAGCSEAPRGLFVLSRGGRICTASSVSPGPSSRQRPDRDTIRAGRNLPDKEFRYLRTVIVTAAIDRGFGSGLAALPLTFRHRAGVTPYTSPCGLAGSCVFGKQSPGPSHCGPLGLPAARAAHPTGASLLPKLRDQLAEFLDEGSPVPLGALAPGHRRRSAVRARAASRPGLFSGAGPGRIARGRPLTLPRLGAPSRGRLRG